MKYLIAIVLFLLASCFTTKPRFFHKELPSYTVCPNGASSTEKKILIIYNNSGGGHVSASKSLAKLLGKEYCLEFMDFSEEIIAKSWGTSSPDHFYNQQLKEQNYKQLNVMVKKLSTVLRIFGWKMKIEFEKKVKDSRPDLIISTIPLINNIVLDVANQNSIPLIVLTMDQKLDNWTVNLNKNLLLKSNVQFTVGLSPKSLYEELHNAGVPYDHTHHTGFPIRQSFREPHSKLMARKKFNIPDNKLVVMVMLGGSSSNFMYDIALELKKIANKNLHIIFVAGRNLDLIKKLEGIKLPNNITSSVFGFVEEVAELMSASDILLSKPGPQSIYEAVHIKIPIIIDMTHGALTHEEATTQFVVENGIGKAFFKLNELNDLILNIAATNNYTKFKKNFDKILLKNFDQEFPKIVKGLVKK